MVRRVRKFVEDEQLLERGDRVVLGVSGGADSVCLLLCLLGLREELELKLRVVHVHHGLRGEAADEDARFVEELCERVGVPCVVKKVDVRGLAASEGISEEEAGRVLRYRVFREEAAGGKIAVAHHRDDQSETVLHHLFRGTGLKGLAGMAPVSGDVIRPLLLVSRKEIEEYLAVCGQEYRIDATNLENVYTRNKIRNQLLPFVEAEINERAGEHLAALAEQAREVDAYLDREATRFMQQYGVVYGKRPDVIRETANGADTSAKTDNVSIGFPVKQLSGLDPVIGKRVLLLAPEWIGGSRRNVGAVHINGLWELVSKPVGSSMNLPGGMVAEKEYDYIRMGFQGQTEGCPALPEMRSRVFYLEKGQKIPEKCYTKWFDYDKIKCNAVLRYRSEGDYLELYGVGRKTVKSYMIDRKIPAKERDHIPVLADGSHVMWIVGYRISEAYKVTEETKRVWEVTVEYDE